MFFYLYLIFIYFCYVYFCFYSVIQIVNFCVCPRTAMENICSYIFHNINLLLFKFPFLSSISTLSVQNCTLPLSILPERSRNNLQQIWLK